jgi:hypothetical protein
MTAERIRLTRLAAEMSLRLRFGFLLLWRGHLRLLAAGGHDVLDPHVGHKVAVVFPVVYVIEVQCAHVYGRNVGSFSSVQRSRARLASAHRGS